MSLDEAAVIRSRPAYLREVWENDDWQVYEVVDASPLVDNGAVVVDVQPDELTIDATRTGWTTLKFRFTDLYTVSEGAACIAPTDGGWIRIFVEQPGRIRLTISLSIGAFVTRGRIRVRDRTEGHAISGSSGDSVTCSTRHRAGDVTVPEVGTQPRRPASSRNCASKL